MQLNDRGSRKSYRVGAMQQVQYCRSKSKIKIEKGKELGMSELSGLKMDNRIMIKC